jgi:hypothetical protein
MSAKRSKTTKELLAAAKLPERSVSICLRGDLVADIEARERDLAAAVADDASNKRLGTKSQAPAIAADIEAMRAEMSDSMLHMRLRALTTTKWRELVRKFPPGKDDKGGLGVDILALMGEAIPASVVEPDDMDDDDWRMLNDSAPAAEMTRLMNVVWELNTQGVDVPKSRLASVVNRRKLDD